MRGGDHEQVVFLLPSLSLSLSALHSFSFREKFLLLFLLHFLVFFFFFSLSSHDTPSLLYAKFLIDSPSRSSRSVCLSLSTHCSFFFSSSPFSSFLHHSDFFSSIFGSEKRRRKIRQKEEHLCYSSYSSYCKSRKIPRDTKW